MKWNWVKQKSWKGNLKSLQFSTFRRSRLTHACLWEDLPRCLKEIGIFHPDYGEHPFMARVTDWTEKTSSRAPTFISLWLLTEDSVWSAPSGPCHLAAFTFPNTRDYSLKIISQNKCLSPYDASVMTMRKIPSANRNVTLQTQPQKRFLTAVIF